MNLLNSTPHHRRRPLAWNRLALTALLAWLALPSAQAQTPPKLNSVSPARSAIEVPLTSALVFVFDQPMMVEVPILPSIPPILVGNLDVEPSATVPSLDTSWSEDGRTLTCVPSADWPARTSITWTLNPAGTPWPISSALGTPLATVSGSFTTGAGGGGGTAPQLVSSTPDNGTFGVPVTTVVTFLFDQPMKKLAVIGDAVRWVGTGVDEAKFVYSWSADGLTLACDYAGDFPADTVVGWALNPGSSVVKLESAAGDLLPEDTYSGGFKTAAGGGGDCTPDGIPASWGGYSVSKGASYQQTSASDPVPASEMPFFFGAFAQGPDAGPAATAGSVTLPNATTKNLAPAPLGGFLYYADEPASESALDTAYPEGSYTLRFLQTGQAERVVPMSMPAFLVPVPKIANYAEAQAVKPAQDFTLRWNAFTGAGANDTVSLIVADPMGKVVFQAPDQCVPRELPVTATTIVLPANSLQNDKTYQATLAFGRLFYSSSNAVPQMAGSGMLSRETHFTLKTGTGGVAMAATFTGYRLSPTGNPEMTLTGTPLRAYTILRARSLGTTVWTDAGVAVMDGAGAAVFEDVQAGKAFPLFYRAVAY